MSYTPKTIKLQEGGPAPLHNFLAPSREEFDASKYSPEEAARIQRGLDNRLTLHDAINNASEQQAMHTMLIGQEEDGPNGSETVYVDVATVANQLNNSSKYSGEDKERWARSLEVINQIQSQGINIVRDENNRYWLENKEDGVRRYSANAIEEVRTLLTEFSKAPVKEGGTTEEDKQGESGGLDAEHDKVIEDLIPAEHKGGFNKHERLSLVAAGTDVLSSVGAVVMKMTGVGAGAGAITSALGGIAATAMDAYSDYLNPEVTGWEAAGNAAMRIGLEGAEAFTFLPVSLIHRFQKGAKYGKLLRKTIHYGMAAGTIDMALGMEYNELLDKLGSDGGMSNLEVDDWRRLGALASFSMSMGSSLHTKAKLKKQMVSDVSATNVGAKGLKKTPAQKKVVKGIKKEIPSPKKMIPKNKIIEKFAAPKKVKINETAVSQKKSNTLAAKEAKKQGTKDQVDLYGERSKAHKANKLRGKDKKVAQEKINTEFDSKAKALKQSTSKEVKTLKAKAAAAEPTAKKSIKKVEIDADKAIRSKRKIAGETIKKKRDKEFNTKLKAREKKVVTKESEMGTTIGKARAKKITQDTKDKVLGKAGEKAINKTEKSSAAKRVTADGKERTKINQDIKKSDKGATDAQKKKIQTLSDRIKKDTEIVREEKIASKKLIAKNKKRLKKATKATVKGAKKIGTRAAELSEALRFTVAANNGAAGKAAIKGVAGVGRAHLEKNRQVSLELIKQQLEAAGYDAVDIEKNHSLRDIRIAHKKAMKIFKEEEAAKEAAKVASKHTGGKLIRKFQNAGNFPVANSGLFGWMTNFVSGLVNSSPEYSPVVAQQPVASVDYSQYKQPTTQEHHNQTLVPKAGNLDNAFNGFTKEQMAASAITGEDPVKPADVPETPETPSEVATNLDNIKIKLEEEKKKKIEEDPPSAAEITEKYDAAIAALDKVDPSSVSWQAQASRILDFIKPSDFIDSGRIIVSRPPQHEIVAPVLHSLGRDNMPGFDYGVARGRLIPRVDTADSFAAHTLEKKFHDQGMRNANELAAKNSAFVERRRAQNLEIANKNLSANVAAVNENTRLTNRAEAIYSQQYNQALAAKTADESKKRSQIINGVTAYAFDASKSIKERELTQQYNKLSTVKNIWNTEYQPRVTAAVKASNMDKVKEIKTQFINEQKYDPDSLNNQILDLRSQYKGLYNG